MVLARGTYVPCVLETDLNSNVPGPSSCVVTENIYSDDGRTVLIDKGAKVQGEYKATLKQGDARLEVIWKRIRTPDGVAIDVESPAGDEHGAVGVAGEIDNHWMQRIGAAFLLSMVQDVVAARAAKQQNSNTTVNTGNTTKSMAEKVLDATINIPPTLFKNRGERLLILVNRDLWFDGVYVLEGARP
jgi:type IV secretion system protein VirB10